MTQAATDSGKPVTVNPQSATEKTAENKDDAVKNPSTVAPKSATINLLDDDNPDTKEFDSNARPDFIDESTWGDLYDGEAGAYKEGSAEKLMELANKAEEKAKGLREKLSKRGADKAPAKPEDYKLQLTEELATVVPADDPLVSDLPNIFHKAGISNDQGQEVLNGVVQWLAENSPESRIENMTEEQQEQYKQEVYKDVGPNAPQVVRAVTEFGRQLKQQGQMDQAMADEFKALGATAGGIKLLNMFRQAQGGDALETSVTLDDGLPSDDKIAKLLQKATMEGDEGAYKEAQEMIEKRQKAGRPTYLR